MGMRSVADIEEDIKRGLDQKVKQLHIKRSHRSTHWCSTPVLPMERLTLEDLEQDLPDVLRTAMAG